MGNKPGVAGAGVAPAFAPELQGPVAGVSAGRPQGNLAQINSMNCRAQSDIVTATGGAPRGPAARSVSEAVTGSQAMAAVPEASSFNVGVPAAQAAPPAQQPVFASAPQAAPAPVAAPMAPMATSAAPVMAAPASATPARVINPAANVAATPVTRSVAAPSLAPTVQSFAAARTALPAPAPTIQSFAMQAPKTLSAMPAQQATVRSAMPAQQATGSYPIQTLRQQAQPQPLAGPSRIAGVRSMPMTRLASVPEAQPLQSFMGRSQPLPSVSAASMYVPSNQSLSLATARLPPTPVNVLNSSAAGLLFPGSAMPGYTPFTKAPLVGSQAPGSVGSIGLLTSRSLKAPVAFDFSMNTLSTPKAGILEKAQSYSVGTPYWKTQGGSAPGGYTSYAGSRTSSFVSRTPNQNSFVSKSYVAR